jgi:disulfide bond formation protein DsbB
MLANKLGVAMLLGIGVFGNGASLMVSVHSLQAYFLRLFTITLTLAGMYSSCSESTSHIWHNGAPHLHILSSGFKSCSTTVRGKLLGKALRPGLLRSCSGIVIS